MLGRLHGELSRLTYPVRARILGYLSRRNEETKPKEPFFGGLSAWLPSNDKEADQ